MKNEQKQQVRAALLRYAATFAGKQQAAASLSGITSASIEQMMQGNYEMVTDQDWRNIARQVGFYQGGWVPADTSVFVLLRLLMDDAREFATHYAIAMAGGSGKTFAAMQYVSDYEGCCYLQADATYNMRSFMAALLGMLQINAQGTIPAMQQQLYTRLDTGNCRLLVIDNAHLLKERVLNLLLQIADMPGGKCGFVLLGNAALGARVLSATGNMAGIRTISLSNTNPADVAMVCKANGLDIPELVERVKEESNGNMHQAQQMIRQLCGLGVAA